MGLGWIEMDCPPCDGTGKVADMIVSDTKIAKQGDVIMVADKEAVLLGENVSRGAQEAKQGFGKRDKRVGV